MVNQVPFQQVERDIQEQADANRDGRTIDLARIIKDMEEHLAGLRQANSAGQFEADLKTFRQELHDKLGFPDCKITNVAGGEIITELKGDAKQTLLPPLNEMQPGQMDTRGPAGKAGKGTDDAQSANESAQGQTTGDQLRKLRNYDKASDAGPDADTRLTDKQLAELMKARNQDSPFRNFEDLGAIADGGDAIPKGRRTADLYDHNETQWLKEIDRRILNGDIDKDTLVVAISGHGPAIGYEMAKHFHSDIFHRIPSGSIEEAGMLESKRDQAQSFAKATDDQVRSGPRAGSSTVLDIDIHQDKPLPQSVIDQLPNADKILAMGIKKIFVGEEHPPAQDGAKPYQIKDLEHARKDDPLQINTEKLIYQWLDNLKKDGRIEIIEDGIDARDINKMHFVQSQS